MRFGDPETQTLMMRLGAGFADALMAAAKGREIPPVEVKDNAVVTVVVASGGYPGEYRKGLPVALGDFPTGVKAFHAGTAVTNGQLVSNGGRVLGVTAEAPTLGQARELAYEGVAGVKFDRAQFRTDIGRDAS